MQNWLRNSKNKSKILRIQKIREKALILAVNGISKDQNRIRIEKANNAIKNLYYAGQSLDSPIEEKMYEALNLILQSRIKSGICLIVPQYEVAGYRLDFAVIDRNVKIGVECDGMLYHQEWEKECTRDRELVVAGFKIMRFTGRQIRNDADDCAVQVLRAIRFAEGAA